MAKTLTSCGGIYIDSATLQTLTSENGYNIITTADAVSVSTYIDGCGLPFDATKFAVLTVNGRNPVITKVGVSTYPQNVIDSICLGVMFDSDYFILNSDNSISYYTNGTSTTVTFTIEEGELADTTIELKNSANETMTNSGEKNIYVVPSGDTYTWTVTNTSGGSDNGSFEATGENVEITPNLATE